MGQEKLGIVNDDVIKAVGAFGGGVASSGGMCGIALGGVALISMLYSRASLDEKEDIRTWTLSSKFMKRFEEITNPHGGINCRDIARMNWQDRDAVKEYYSNPESRRKICTQLVGEAAAILGELLERE